MGPSYVDRLTKLARSVPELCAPDLAVVLEVSSEVDGGAAGADFARNGMAVGEGGCGFRHSTL